MKLKQLTQCIKNNGYIKIRKVWRYNSSSLHARINRRVGLEWDTKKVK